MKIAIVGCGYVFDHYMTTLSSHPVLELRGVFDSDPERMRAVEKIYGVTSYKDFDAVLSDSDVELVLNLTSIESHASVIRALLLAGKHVYTEKPVSEDLEEVRSLFALAEELNLHLSAAPCNYFSDTVATMRRAIQDGAIGTPRVVYAEFDDNPIYLMKPESWRSRSGAPWPWKSEYEHGCTVEHAGYYLSWLVALFGPVERVVAFSKVAAPDKAENTRLTPPDAADFSVACLDFKCGVAARVTISIVAPYDQRFRIIGNRGELWTDTYRHFQNPVRLEVFTQTSLNARKARAVRVNGFLRWIFGVGGRHVPLIRRPTETHTSLSPGGMKKWLRQRVRNQLGQQDKCLGPALVAKAIEGGGAPPIPPDFIIHINELTMLVHRAGVLGEPIALQTTCRPLPLEDFIIQADRSRAYYVPGVLTHFVDMIVERLHRH